MFLFKHAHKFEGLGLDKFSVRNVEPKSIFEWTYSVRQHPEGKGYTKFVTDFMSRAYEIIHDSPTPRIFPKQKELLQFSETDCVGDWYLFEDHTEIRVYGCAFPPYKLPKFVPMRIFSLEYRRKIIHMDDLHFV